jgi:hypothetical protein
MEITSDAIPLDVPRFERLGDPLPAGVLTERRLRQVVSAPLHRQSYELRAAFQRLYALGQGSSSPRS